MATYKNLQHCHPFFSLDMLPVRILHQMWHARREVQLIHAMALKSSFSIEQRNLETMQENNCLKLS